MKKNSLQGWFGLGSLAVLLIGVTAWLSAPLAQAQSTPTFNSTITPTDTGIAPPNTAGTQTSSPSSSGTFNSTITPTDTGIAPPNTAGTQTTQTTPNSAGSQTAPSVPNSAGTATQTTGGTNTTSFGLQNPLSKNFNSVGSLISGFLDIFSYLVILLAVLLIIWVGLQFVLARGNTDRIKELKVWLLWIVVGVAIVIGARIIVSAVINTLSATGMVNQNVINQTHNALGQ